jgi:hypothetical protein
MKLRKRRRKDRIIQMVLVIVRTDKNRQKNESRSKGKLEVDALYASEKYLNISSVYYMFKENLISIVWEPTPIKLCFGETSVYHIIYRRF